MQITHNKLLLSDQGKLSRRLHAQPPRQLILAPEQERYLQSIISCRRDFRAEEARQACNIRRWRATPVLNSAGSASAVK
jgi:hypothetical protein